MQSILNFSKWKISILIAVMTLVLQPKLAASNSNDAAILQAAITGTVTDANTGEALPGVSIAIKGTTVGTITDIDGQYTINASEGDILLYSFIGYLNEEVTIAGNTTIDIALAVDVVGLDEVVVVGYGTQKKKLNTGATLNMKGEDLEKRNTGDAMSSLQGISPGVYVTKNNGAPGSGTKVNIRGVGTTGNANPLYVVDGVQVDNIDYLNPSDIASIDVLKDGASSAIYGSRAANGVILVTTKKGEKGAEPLISYDSYVGWQEIAKVPEVLGAQEFIQYQNEAHANSNRTEPDWANMTPDYENIVNGSNPGTDWFGELYNQWAVVQNHSLGMMGSSEKSSYSAGASYYSDEGLLGEMAQPAFKRITLRLNSDHILKEINGHSLIKFGQNLTYTNTVNPNIGTGNIYASDVRNALVASPLMPVYDPNGGWHYALNFANDEGNAKRYGDDPRYAGLTGRWSDSPNPQGLLNVNRKYSENNNNRVVGNAYLEIQPIKNLVIRSSIGLNTYWSSSRNWTPVYDLGVNDTQEQDIVQQAAYMGYNWILTNTASYNFSVQDQHNFNIVIGQEAQKTERQLELRARNQESLYQNWDQAYLYNVPYSSINYMNWTNEDDPNAIVGWDQYGWAMNSYFGRLSYDFREKYLLTLILRKDGTSKFAEGNQYGDAFKSVSAGWIASNEEFMNAVPAISYLKVRGSYGENGNQAIDDFTYLALIESQEAGYGFGNDKNSINTGAVLSTLPNPQVGWETSKQTNIGLDINFLNNRLQTMFDWYNKTTADWLVVAPALASYGADPPFVNGGSVENKGIEAMIRWSDRKGDFSYTITGTVGYNKNEVTEINNEEQIIRGGRNVLAQGMAESHRAEVGHPIGYFWGYETAGIMRSDEDVTAYVQELEANADAWAAANGTEPAYDATLTESRLAPGEVKFVDKNGDGLIDDEDKTEIGDPNAKINYGIQINLAYKNFYFDLIGVGKSGLQVARSWRGYTDRFFDNYPKDIAENAFHIDNNPNGDLPRLTTSPTASRVYVSDIYIHDADYFRISNLTLGYNFKEVFGSNVFKDLRLYVTAQNLATFTKYVGMDPEVGYGPENWSSGYDLGLYPLARTYMVGLNVKF